MNKIISYASKRLVSALAIGAALFAFSERADAQEILLTGPLAGAPAVRQLRLYRQTRFEIAPQANFTLQDEYQREILFGARLTFNITDWLGIGAWGAYGAIKIPTALSEHIQEVNKQRRAMAPGGDYDNTLTGRLTHVNMSNDFKKQIGSINWAIAPQLTLVPLRGKIALFQSIFLDTDFYLFGGPAFIGLSERKNCANAVCGQPGTFELVNRVAIAPTFCAGLTFYVNKWSAIGFEWRALPFAYNNGGFDTAGGGKDKKFPDNAVSSADQGFHFVNMAAISYNFYLPTQYKISE